MKCTSVFSKTLRAFNNSDCRYIVSVGSTRSSKTYSALQLVLLHVLHHPNKRWLITSSTFQKVRLTTMRDWTDILAREKMEDRFDVNLSEHIWTCLDTNSKVEFMACETEAKARGIRSDFIVADEANVMDYAIADALIVRCTGKVILTLNPSQRGWIEDNIIPQPECIRIHSTYKDNEFLTKEQIRSIESHRNDERWWKVFAEGEYAGGYYNVYSNWRMATPEDDIESRFQQAEMHYFGLDWGYMTDPTAVVEVVKYGKRLYCRELLYKQHLLNEEISEHLNNTIDRRAPYRFVFDSAEMKSGDTVKKLTNLRMEPSKKGPDSIRNGIAQIQEYELIVDPASTNLLSELEQYSWVVDKSTNKATSVPEDKNNHLLDPLRYIALNFLYKSDIKTRTTIV